MLIHEYQAKAILEEHGVPVPAGRPAFTVAEAVDAAEHLGGERWAVKAQIHAGGRGKAGGVQLADSLEEVRQRAEGLLERTLVTEQTGTKGRLVRRLLVEKAYGFTQEFYVGAVVDRHVDSIVFMASSEGGVEIEEVARTNPEKILKVTVDPAVGLQPFQARKLGFGLGMDWPQVRQFTKILMALYRAFVDKDASLVELNPLVVTDEGDLLALDAKFNLDDNGLIRHKDLTELRDPNEEEPKEHEATAHGLNYIALEGNIGCMVNGAGLAMATMDIIKLYGGEPANFLDVGGGTSVERVTAAFKILLSDANVEAILINIFGGIVRCDVIAEGILAAAQEVELNVPLVVRLEGTNVEQGRKLLEDSGLDLITATTLADAAEKAVTAGKGAA
ncbi:MAG: ADP-forming succinate--CoA ligase subunit beta [Thiohalorhabdus sp.]|uniref:ADP-forming succinate--CoA ligase subunit beta n=1 Tax=Thiohalorhabdus sp. TaxID=3094134 RepID=UPI00397EE504